ncbi:MAG: hypothetical protein WC979_02685 [Candidatus Pacearchaeota archaeon]|jgi:hypothetical protein|nr:hypothetical protein [Clostridia bacterium]
MEDLKTMSGEEFRDKGYLQEANRQFFHRLGLALSMIIDAEGNVVSFQIVDKREDKEGIYFDLKTAEPARIKKFHKNANFIGKEMNKRTTKRMKLFGSSVEPIPTASDENSEDTLK